jgi:hypothetical protein
MDFTMSNYAQYASTLKQNSATTTASAKKLNKDLPAHCTRHLCVTPISRARDSERAIERFVKLKQEVTSTTPASARQKINKESRAEKGQWDYLSNRPGVILQ